eukprot:gene16376-22578_t
MRVYAGEAESLWHSDAAPSPHVSADSKERRLENGDVAPPQGAKKRKREGTDGSEKQETEVLHSDAASDVPAEYNKKGIRPRNARLADASSLVEQTFSTLAFMKQCTAALKRVRSNCSPIGMLQHICQKTPFPLPVYAVQRGQLRSDEWMASTSFSCSLGTFEASGTGITLKTARLAAALDLLKQLASLDEHLASDATEAESLWHSNAAPAPHVSAASKGRRLENGDVAPPQGAKKRMREGTDGSEKQETKVLHSDAAPDVPADYNKQGVRPRNVRLADASSLVEQHVCLDDDLELDLMLSVRVRQYALLARGRVAEAESLRQLQLRDAAPAPHVSANPAERIIENGHVAVPQGAKKRKREGTDGSEKQETEVLHSDAAPDVPAHSKKGGNKKGAVALPRGNKMQHKDLRIAAKNGANLALNQCAKLLRSADSSIPDCLFDAIQQCERLDLVDLLTALLMHNIHKTSDIAERKMEGKPSNQAPSQPAEKQKQKDFDLSRKASDRGLAKSRLEKACTDIHAKRAAAAEAFFELGRVNELRNAAREGATLAFNQCAELLRSADSYIPDYLVDAIHECKRLDLVDSFTEKLMTTIRKTSNIASHCF